MTWKKSLLEAGSLDAQRHEYRAGHTMVGLTYISPLHCDSSWSQPLSR